MAEIQRPDATLYAEQVGEGPPVLLLAGIASDVASWTPLVPLLSPRHRLIMPDNRGAGRTLSKGAITLDQMLGDALAVLDHYGIARAHVAGHSMGGMIGLRFAAAHPDRVASLSLLASSPYPRQKEVLLLTDMVRLFGEGVPPQLWYRLLFQFLFAPGFFDQPANVEAAAIASANYPWRQSPADLSRQIAFLRTLTPLDMAALSLPVLSLMAEWDIMLPPALARADLTGLPDHRERVIPGAGHSIHWDKPRPTADALLDFWASHAV